MHYFKSTADQGDTRAQIRYEALARGEALWLHQ
jgi:hypothetical protein